MPFIAEEKQKEFLTKVRREEEETRAKLLAEKVNFPYLNLAFTPIESDALKLIPKEKALKAKAAVINRKVKTLNLVVLNPDDKETQSLIAELEKSGYAIKIFIVSKKSLEKALSYYAPSKELKEITGQVKISDKILTDFQKEIADIKALEQVLGNLFKAKASQIVEAVLAGALILKASDIHFEPESEKVRVRLRLDGVLEDTTNVPPAIYSLVLNRIKLLLV